MEKRKGKEAKGKKIRDTRKKKTEYEFLHISNGVM